MPTSPSTHTVYLVRHGIAAERSDERPDDSKRPLTPKGMARMREIARGLRALDPAIDVVLTSPFARAKQTADLLVDGLKPAPALHVIGALSPGVGAAAVVEALQQYRKATAVALVGHEPDLGELAAWFLGANAPPAFKKGGIARIDLPRAHGQGSGELVWFATPKMLRGLK
jgi:phosphohistidine phosphatase